VHYAAGQVRAIDAASAASTPPSAGIAVGAPADAAAVNPVTNKVYVITENSGGPVAVIDGATLGVTSLAAAGHAAGAKSVAVNPVTNRVYAGFRGEVMILNGATNAMTFIPSGASAEAPAGLAINAITNKIYAANPNGTLTVIDGDTEAATTLAIPAGATAIAVNAVTNMVYVATPLGVTVISGAATDTVHAVPITTTITPLPGNLSGADRTFTLNASDTFAPTAPGVRRVYYALDSTRNAWTAATGSGPFSAAVTGMALGAHTLYAFATDGQDASLTGGQSHPLVGNIASYAFTVTATPPPADAAVALSSTPNPAVAGQSVRFTASVSGPAGVATGTMNFLDGATSIAGCPAVALAAGVAACNTTSLAAGSHSVTAKYSGNASYNAATSAPFTQVINPALANATIALASSANPSTSGQATTFTATLSGSAGVPTGSVDFRDGAASIPGCATVAISAGTAACATSSLTPGAHSITVRYSGDAKYNAGASAALAQSVKVVPSVSVASSPNPSTSGQNVTFTITVSGTAGTPTGTVDLRDGAASIGPCSALALSGGIATCATTSLAAGAHAVTARYPGNAMYNPATSAALTQTVNGALATPSVTLASTPNPSTAGQGVTFTATVSGTAETPTGTVQFLDGTVAIAGCTAVAISAGAATCAASALAVGAHSITARYSGNASYNAATSSATTQTVKANATLTVASSLNPSTSGQSVTFTAIVSGGSGSPTGTVDFRDGATSIAGCAAVAISAGAASCATSGLSLGTHSITAAYSGNATYNATTSNPLNQTVNGLLANPTVSLSSNQNPSAAGQDVSFQLDISGSAGTPTGIVEFRDGANVVPGCGAITVTQSRARCTTTSLAVGSHSMTALYSGNASYNPGTSTAIIQTVNALSSANVRLTSSVNPSSTGQSVTFTTTVSGASGTPTGTVNFRDDTTSVAGCSAVPLAAGTATCTTTDLAAGTHSISAQYSGSATYGAATSASLSQGVNSALATPSLTLSTTLTPSRAGEEVRFEVNLSGPSGAPTGTVDFRDGATSIPGCAAVAVSQARARCTTSRLTVGTHAITARYSGNSTYGAATSGTLNQVITQ
jgi:hypothetical protein